jgi:type IV secretion system protein VirB1
MPIDLTSLITLAAACAPSIDQGVLLSVAKVESGFEPLAIGVNSKPRRSWRRSHASRRLTPPAS